MYVCMKYVCMYMCVCVCVYVCVLCSIEKESEPGLPIEEDPIAHVLLKRLLNLELSLETQGSGDGGDGLGSASGASGVDTSMWMNPHKFPEKKETKKGDKKNKKNKAVIATPAEEGQGNTYLSIGCYICVCMYVCMYVWTRRSLFELLSPKYKK